MANDMSAARAARSKPEDFATYICPVCKGVQRPRRDLNPVVSCGGPIDRPHRPVSLKETE